MDGQATGTRKRKADNQDNERLSKRLSRLNLERNGQVLYVPVEEPSPDIKATQPDPSADNDLMQVDDTKHRIFIYNLDDELSDSESDDGKVVFLPDLEKHLRESRIPASILANSEGELAGNKQMVLYNVPSSLTVPEEQDSVRRAIIEARARSREKQQKKRVEEEEEKKKKQEYVVVNGGVHNKDWYTSSNANGVPLLSMKLGDQQQSIDNKSRLFAREQEMADDDPDAMDLG